MKHFLMAAAAALLLSTAAQAKDFNIPSEKPVASITMPEGWTANETDSGLEGTSADSAVYFAVDISEAAALDKTIQESVKFLEEQGVKIDEKTEKQKQDKLNGKDAVFVSWAGTDKDGPATIGLALVLLDEKNALVLTYWGTKGEEDKHGAEINSIVTSIKSAK
ncbi:histidine kinase [Rhizobium sp. C4]|uniref:histidine kinase n=1 Tax=Rhizobium sp. C4 TaxID=1349800 RepID=UPI001E503B31|nr:histidine kinase [Rhizobium sp. C4]MCD2175314.1 histidine kinase [Rhizobium sp. C4]